MTSDIPVPGQCHFPVIARALNLWSPDPIQADIDKGLQQEAAKIGADAVIFVNYQVDRTGLDSSGKLTGKGRAIKFKP